MLLAGPPVAAAETLRVATYNVDLSRDGPGLLLYELRRPPKPGLAAVARVIQTVRPDVLLLTQFDHDLRGRALAAFLALLRAGPDGIDYPYWFDAPVNAGVDSGLDLDGDGLPMGWSDALGWGKFPGNGGMALISRFAIDAAATRTFRDLLWADLPGASLPMRPDGRPFLGAEALAALPLSSRSHWDVAVDLPGGARLRVLASNPTPPLFDGAEGMNRRRNDDEIGFWTRYLDGAAFRDDQGRAGTLAAGPLVLLGDLNADPVDGAGLGEALRRLLGHPRLRDPAPESAGAEVAANPRHRGPPERDTADWRDAPGPGNLRVDYALPSRDLVVLGSGVFWPAPGEPLAEAVAAGPAHRLVWVDLGLP